MITGRDTLQEIDGHLIDAQARIQDADRELERLNAQVSRLQLETAKQYRKLARFRLDEMAAGKLTARLKKAYLAVPAFLDQHRQAFTALEKSIGRVQQRRQALEQRRRSRRDARDKAAEALGKQVAESKKDLERIEDYRRQRENAVAAAAVARRAVEKASKSESELDEKGRPYRNDVLFMYLWQRRYLTPDYGHIGIIRMLDGWVAHLIHYRALHDDYRMLNALPRRLRAHASAKGEEAERQRQLLLSLEKKAAEKDGIPALQAALDEAEKALQRVNDEIEAEEQRHHELLRQRNDFAAGKDEYTRKAIDLMAAGLEHEDASALLQQARATPRPEDDAIVLRLQALKQAQESAGDRIVELDNEQRRQRRILEEIAKVRGKFRRSNYDARYSSFPANLGLGILLGEVLRGSRSAGSAWDRIDHAQKWDFPDGGGPGGGGFGGFGGFGSGGGFGGGGFSSGGGF